MFAPSNIYPIGNRFNVNALDEVFEIFNCKRLIRGCGCRESSGAELNFDNKKCISIVSGCSTNHRSYKSEYKERIFK